MIKAIIFDFFGVFSGDKWKEFVGTVSESQQQTARELNRSLDKGTISHDEFYDQIYSLTGVIPDKVEGIINSEMSKNIQLIQYAIELKKIYKIGLLSNVSSTWISDSFFSADELLIFDDIIFSYQVGMVKPDPNIYKLSAKRLGVAPDECVFIDDGQGNCDGAKSVGMESILYLDLTQLKSNLEPILRHM